MNIFYPLCLLTLFACILFLMPSIVKVNRKPITKYKIIIMYFCATVFLYYIRHFPIFYYIALLTCVITTIALILICYFSFQEHLLDKHSGLSIRFERINQMKGLDFEHFVAEVLRKQGFKKVQVTKATGDFGVDIFCYSKKGKSKIAIQVKRYNSPITGKAIQEVVAGANHYKADKTMVVTNSTFTPKARILAKSNNCELIDGTTLKRWVYENEMNIKNKKNNKESNNPALQITESVSALPSNVPAIQYMNFADIPFDPELDKIDISLDDLPNSLLSKQNELESIKNSDENVVEELKLTIRSETEHTVKPEIYSEKLIKVSESQLGNISHEATNTELEDLELGEEPLEEPLEEIEQTPPKDESINEFQNESHEEITPLDPSFFDDL